MSTHTEKPTQVITPSEQDAVTFYGRQLVAARLTDGRIVAVLRWLCEGIGLDANGQLQRIKRKTAVADGLLYVQIETAAGRKQCRR